MGIQSLVTSEYNRNRINRPFRHPIEQCIAMQQAVHFLGPGEGDLALAQAAIYLAVAPKSASAHIKRPIKNRVIATASTGAPNPV